MRIKTISITLLLAMILSLATMGMISTSAVELVRPGDWEQRKGLQDQDFSFVFVGDTQYVTYGDYQNGTKELNQVYQWIADNVEKKHIAHVFALGDMTDRSCGNDPDMSYGYGRPGFASGDGEWKIVKEAVSKLDGVVPYSLVRGNHDDLQINDFFNYEAYTSQFDGFYQEPEGFYKNSLANSYKLMEIQGIKFLMMTLDFNLSKEAAAWADKIIGDHPDYNVIITMHAYMHPDLRPLTYKDDSSSYVSGKWRGVDGEVLWNDYLSKHSNILMIVSGHVGTDNVLFYKSVGTNGNEVYNVLVDGQSYDQNVQHSGLVFIMNFYDGGKRLKTEYYATLLDRYKIKNDKNWVLKNIQLPEVTTTITEATTTVGATTAPAETSAEATETTGCGSAVSLVSIALLPAFATFSAVSLKKRKDREQI